MKKIIAMTLFLWGAPTSGIAEIYKHTDEVGRITYGNTPKKGAIPISVAPGTLETKRDTPQTEAPSENNPKEHVHLTIPNEKAVIAAMNPLSALKKDTFEKTADFTKRVCAETYKALGTGGEITLALEHMGEYATYAKYNADKETFDIYLGQGHYYNTQLSYEDQWKWNPYIDVSKYSPLKLASITDISATKGAVKIGTDTQAILFYPGKTNKYKITLQANPVEAKKLNGDLRVAIATRIQSPCILVGTGHTTPTRDYPYDTTNHVMGLIASKKTEWILYLSSTNEIIKRGKFY